MKSCKVEIERVVRHLAPCPVPGCAGRFSVGHVLQWARERNCEQHVGPWFCDECGAGVDWRIPVPDPVAHAVVAIGTLTGIRKIDRLVLLNLDTEHKVVRLVVQGMRFEGEERDGAGDAYFYNEYTCPTNYLKEVEVIIDGDDPDPHGLFQFSDAVDLDDALKTRLCEMAVYRMGADKEDWQDALGNLSVDQILALFNDRPVPGGGNP